MANGSSGPRSAPMSTPASAHGGSVVIKLAYADSVHRFVVPDPWFHTVTAVSNVVAKPSPSATVGVGPWHRLMALLQRTLHFTPQQMRSVFVYSEDEDDFVVPITNDHELRKCVEISQTQMLRANTGTGTGTGPAAAPPKTLKLFISHDPPSPSAALSKPLIVRASSSAPTDTPIAGDDKQVTPSATATAGAADTNATAGAPVDAPGEEGRATFHAADLDAEPVADFALSLDSDYFAASASSSSSGNAAAATSPPPSLRLAPAPASPAPSSGSRNSSAHSGNGNSGKGNGPGGISGGTGKSTAAAAADTEDGEQMGGGVMLMGDIKVVDWHFAAASNSAASHPANSTPSSASRASASANIMPVLWSASPSKPWQRLASFVDSLPQSQPQSHAVITRGLFAAALAVPPALPTLPAGTANARFVASPKTLPDGCVVSPGRPVVQHWVFRNTGTRAWPTPTRLVYCHGNAHDTPFPPVPIPSIAPGQQVTIALTVHLPNNADGRYWAVYRLCGAPAGADTGSCRFGDSVWLDVTAKTEHQQQLERASKRIAIEPVRY